MDAIRVTQLELATWSAHCAAQELPDLVIGRVGMLIVVARRRDFTFVALGAVTTAGADPAVCLIDRDPLLKRKQAENRRDRQRYASDPAYRARRLGHHRQPQD